MASIEERGDGFRVRWRTLAGEPRSRQCPDRATARRLKAEVERAQALGQEWAPTPERGDGAASKPDALPDAIAAYLDDAARRLRPKTVTRKRIVLGMLLDWLADDGEAPGLGELTRDNLHRWHGALLARDLSRRSAAAYLYEASFAWQWIAASDEFEGRVRAWRPIDAGSVPPPPRLPAPTMAQVDAAIAASHTPRRPLWPGRLMTVMRYTGLRAGQVRALRWDDLDLEALRIVVRPELGKSKAEQRGRVVPMHPGLRTELAGWGRREGLLVPVPVSGTDIDYSLLRRIWADAGIEARQPLHGIRHAFATTIRAAGHPEDVVGYLLGHAGTVTGAHYIDPSAALWPQLVAAVASIPPAGVRTVSALDDARRKTAK